MKIVLFYLISLALGGKFDIFQSDAAMRTFITSGSQQGRFFTLNEFWEWFDALRQDMENR